MQVVQCLRLQAMGFTSKEISDILNHTSSADMGSLFEKKRDLLVGQYHLYGEMIQYLDYLSGKGGNDFLKEETKEWSIIKPEGFYYMENASQGRFT